MSKEGVTEEKEPLSPEEELGLNLWDDFCDASCISGEEKIDPRTYLGPNVPLESRRVFLDMLHLRELAHACAARNIEVLVYRE